jgi:hypothetical protein
VKILLVFLIILVTCITVGGLIAGFAYGIIKRGKKLRQAEAQLKNIALAVELWDDIDHVLAADIKQILKNER